MNRMIAMFQRRADNAMHEYCKHRERTCKYAPNSPEWNEQLPTGSRLAAEYKTWQKAADLLRKEELNK